MNNTSGIGSMAMQTNAINMVPLKREHKLVAALKVGSIIHGILGISYHAYPKLLNSRNPMIDSADDTTLREKITAANALAACSSYTSTRYV